MSIAQPQIGPALFWLCKDVKEDLQSPFVVCIIWALPLIHLEATFLGGASTFSIMYLLPLPCSLLRRLLGLLPLKPTASWYTLHVPGCGG